MPATLPTGRQRPRRLALGGAAGVADAGLVADCAELARQVAAYSAAWGPTDTLAPGPELDALNERLSAIIEASRALMQTISATPARTVLGRRAKAEALEVYLGLMPGSDLPEITLARSLAADVLADA